MATSKHDSIPSEGSTSDSNFECVPDPSTEVATDSPKEEVLPTVPGFQIIKTLGVGGFGVAYLAEKTDGSGKVALKVAHADVKNAVPILEAEGQVMKDVGPPGAPAFAGGGITEDGRAWLAMDFCPGKEFPSQKTKGKPYQVAGYRLMKVLRPLLTSLAQIHQAGYVHADLKPENFIVTGEDAVTIIDYGLSKKVVGEGTNSDVCASLGEHDDGEVVGSPYYMSPEQSTDGVLIDRRSDVYSVGIIIYELLAGAVPFSGSDEVVREAQRSQRPPTLFSYGVHESLEDFVFKCLHKDPSSRFESAVVLLDELEKIVAKLPEIEPTGMSPEALKGQQSEQQAEASTEQGEDTPNANKPKREKKDKDKKEKKKEKETVGLVWFASSSAQVAIKRAVADLEGLLAHSAKGKCVVAFTRSSGRHPLEAALKAAHSFVSRGLTETTIADLADVRVRRKDDGSERIAAAIFKDDANYPDESCPRGALVRANVAESLADLQAKPCPKREDLLLVAKSESSLDLTTVGGTKTQLFGHAEKFETLMAACLKAHENREPGLATVVGDRGMGKTLLSRELAGRLIADPRKPHTFALQAQEPVGHQTQPLLRNVLRMALRMPNKFPEDLSSFLTERLGSEPTQAVIFGTQLAFGLLPDDDPRVARLRVAPGALRSAQVTAVAEILTQLSQARPMSILIDDGQYVDDVTLDTLEYVTRPDHRASIWACIVARPNFLEARPKWGVKVNNHTKIELGALDDESANSLIRHLLKPAAHVASAIVNKIRERTRSVPLFMTELIRGLKRDGLVVRHKHGDGYTVNTDILDESPDLISVSWLFTKELDALPLALKTYAGLAAMLGSEFRPDEVAGLFRHVERCGIEIATDLDPTVGARRLRRSGALVENVNGTFNFGSPMFRDAAYNSVAEDVRTRIHAAAYSYYDAEQNADVDHRLTRLTLHAVKAGMTEEATELLIQLAGRASNQHNYMEAEGHYRQALGYLAEGDDRIFEVSHGRAMIRFHLARHTEAKEDLEKALSLCAGRKPEIDVRLDLAMVLDWLDEYKTSADLVEKAAQLIGQYPSELNDARIVSGRARAHFRKGEWEDAGKLYKEAADKAAQIGEDAYFTRVSSLLMAAPIMGFGGNTEQALCLFDELIATCKEHNDQVHLSSTYLNRAGGVWLPSADKEKVIEDYRAAINAARVAGSDTVEQWGLASIAEVQLYLADYDDALNYQEQSSAIAKGAHGEGYRYNETLLRRARIMVAAGRIDEASECISTIEAVREKTLADENTEADFTPSELALLVICKAIVQAHQHESVQLERWEELRALAEKDSVQHEYIEVLQLLGTSAAQLGQYDTGIKLLKDAVERSEAEPNLLVDRIRRSYEAAETMQNQATG